MIFSSDFNRRETNPLIFIICWRQACPPSLFFDTELFTLNASQLIKLKRCQQWFLKNIFYVPNFAPNSLLLKLSGLNSIESEIDLKKLMCFGGVWSLSQKWFLLSDFCFQAELIAFLYHHNISGCSAQYM